VSIFPTASIRSKPIIETIVLIAFAVLVAFLVKFFLLQLFYIPSGSMEPNLQIDDNIFVNKLAYEFKDVERGDIVVLTAPKSVTDADPKIKDLIKRVIGLPGEIVEGVCENGEETCVVKVYITKPGQEPKLLTEPYINSDPKYSVYGHFGPYEVPANSVLLLGDNRANSQDGRKFGTVNKDLIIGRAFLRVWPLGRAGLL
jgi:signal peptidase I